MDFMPWQAVIFQSIPESIILISLGLGFLGLYPPFNGVVLVATVYSLSSVVIRGLPLPFGAHTLILLPLLAVLLKLFFKIEWWRAATAALLGTIIFGLVESISIPLMLFLTGYDLATVMHDSWLRVLFPLPDEIILGMLAWIVWKKRLSLFRPGRPKFY
ncbi:hypothetical protein SAMN00808754_1076 [Thermanaeromonas toyohensis ToBE]|uniref:Uncharacterized protein n=1 Tax=Thermanaeromonas toyohensis ToBE TaxID=698762 RepID=A0A1W1VMP1_9FIRM|nr:hypothetical protein [Thermanaeromonas toyohensis]SMB94627.1 hypothetical protein SAMN00808754_1076 [Thermanaeromonas toyohensis ToBE]